MPFPTTDHCRNYLPHFENRQYQMITFRLYDSLPQTVIEEWKEESILLQNEILHSQTHNLTELEKKRRLEIKKKLDLVEKYEDAGYGQCFMGDDRFAGLMKEALLYNDNKRYDLICWCIMPNHVHVLISPFEEVSMSKIMFDWKSYTTHTFNKLLGRIGKIWMNEYFDRYIRDIDHFNKVVDYIENNPVKAGIVTAPSDYKWSSAYKERC